MEKFCPVKPEKETISVRLPSNLIEELDRKSAAVDISRNELINQCILFALRHMEDGSEEDSE